MSAVSCNLQFRLAVLSWNTALIIFTYVSLEAMQHENLTGYRIRRMQVLQRNIRIWLLDFENTCISYKTSHPSCKVQLLQRWIGQKLIIKGLRWEAESVLCNDQKPRVMAQTQCLRSPFPSPDFPSGTRAGHTLSLPGLARANAQRSQN